MGKGGELCMTEIQTISKSELIIGNIVEAKRKLGGVIKPCGDCSFVNEVTLCDEPRGIRLNRDENPVCPMNENQVVKLIIQSK